MPRQALDLDQARDVSGLVLRQGMPDHQELLRPSQDRRPALLSIRTEWECISSRRKRIELGIELTPSGSAGAVVRLVAVLVGANRLAIVAVMPTRVNLRILRLPLLSANRRHPVLHSTRRSAGPRDARGCRSENSLSHAEQNLGRRKCLRSPERLGRLANCTSASPANVLEIELAELSELTASACSCSPFGQTRAPACYDMVNVAAADLGQ
jgi:hypothetical protein